MPERWEDCRFWPTLERCLLAYPVGASQQKYFCVFMTARFTTKADIAIQNSPFALPLCASMLNKKKRKKWENNNTSLCRSVCLAQV